MTQTRTTLALMLMLLVLAPGLALAQAQKAQPPTTAQKKKAEQKKKKPTVRLAFSGGRVITGAGQTFNPGVILVENGKITQIGPAHEIQIPKDHKTIDAKGYTLCPGFVLVKPTNVALTGKGSWADRFDRFHPEGELLHALGITTYYAGGRMSSARLDKNNAVIRLVRDTKEDKVLLKTPACVTLDYASARGTRRATVKKTFEAGRKYITDLADYHAKLEKWKKDLDAWKKREAARQAAAKKAAAAAANKPTPAKAPAKPPAKAPAKPPAKKPAVNKDPRPVAPTKPKASSQIQLAAQVLERKLPLRLQGRTVGHLRQVVALARELKIQPIIDGATEGWTMAGDLASVGSRVVVNPRDRMEPPVRGDRSRGWTVENAHDLDQGGVRVTLAPQTTRFGYWGVTGDDLLTFRLTPAFAVRGGLSEQKALAGITSEAAKLLGVADQVGSLQPGRYADILFMTGDPLHYRSLIERVYISGRLNYDRAKATWFKHIKRRKP